VAGHTEFCAEKWLNIHFVNEKQCNVVAPSAEMLSSALRFWIKHNML